MKNNFYTIKLPSVDSTNNWAKNALANNAIKPGAVIVAETQTHGRGQMQTNWHDDPGKNLLFTAVVHVKDLSPNSFFRLNEIASLAICDVLQDEYGCLIKWPNDVYIGHKKVAGILIENVLQGDAIKTAFIGMGINVNQLQFAAGLHATSLALEKRENLDKNNLLEKIIAALATRLEQLHQPKILIHDYFNVLLGADMFLKYKAKNETFLARIEQVEPDGELILREKTTGAIKKYRFKEVQLLL